MRAARASWFGVSHVSRHSRPQPKAPRGTSSIETYPERRWARGAGRIHPAYNRASRRLNPHASTIGTPELEVQGSTSAWRAAIARLTESTCATQRSESDSMLYRSMRMRLWVTASNCTVVAAMGIDGHRCHVVQDRSRFVPAQCATRIVARQWTPTTSESNPGRMDQKYKPASTIAAAIAHAVARGSLEIRFTMS